MDMLETMIDIGADLQKRNIAHRNIKPQNVIINKENSFRDLRLINFEMGVILDHDMVALTAQDLKIFKADVEQELGLVTSKPDKKRMTPAPQQSKNLSEVLSPSKITFTEAKMSPERASDINSSFI